MYTERERKRERERERKRENDMYIRNHSDGCPRDARTSGALARSSLEALRAGLYRGREGASSIAPRRPQGEDD